MTNETLFSLASSAVVPGWLLLVVAPGWKWTTRLVTSVLLPALLGLLYVYLIATQWAGSQGGFGSLAEVRQLFENPGLLLAGWVHYLAFDLFVGTWEVRDARRLALPHLAVVPCLLLTFLFGPIGLLLYFALRGALRRRVLLED
ncbi:MAG: ABA4-like family protein [Vicinamibacterales bacterium]|jgi:hypothetical protein